MALSRVAYTAAPAQTVFAITFPSLSSDHIHVFVDEVELTQPTEFTVNSARTQVTLVTPATGGEYVEIKRVTPTDPIVDWIEGSSILAEDLDTMYLQLVYQHEETQDDSAESLQLLDDGSGNWDAEGNRITNVADAVDQQDATTLAQLQAAAIVAGNLPPVTGADNDKFIQVKAGAWVTRTPAQVEADIGVDTLQTQMAAAQAAITALQAGRPMIRANVTATVVQFSASGTWYESAGTRLDFAAGTVIEHNNATPHYTLGADTITLEEDGTYLLTVNVSFVSADAGPLVTELLWRLTDGTDGPAQVSYYNGALATLATNDAPPHEPRYSETAVLKVVVSGTPKVLVLRAKVNQAAEPIDVEAQTFVLVEQLA